MSDRKPKLTDPLTFAPEVVCRACGLPGTHEEDPDPPIGYCLCDEPDFVIRTYHHYLDDCHLVKDITCIRLPGVGPLVDIQQRYFVSTEGFDWGYGNTEAGELALNVLCLFIPPQESWRLYVQFKWQVIANLPAEGATLNARKIRFWIKEQWRKP